MHTSWVNKHDDGFSTALTLCVRHDIFRFISCENCNLLGQSKSFTHRQTIVTRFFRSRTIRPVFFFSNGRARVHEHSTKHSLMTPFRTSNDCAYASILLLVYACVCVSQYIIFNSQSTTKHTHTHARMRVAHAHILCACTNTR